ncbi:ATP-grasp domain-containing protein [Actinomadura fibrosa]|uniref:ATP-grasp domain-containing protein n=1 Tax=Actinomadura fibrosa TaxID=111802 RepID=A0ABW2XBL0_9ACTN|nr:ATP-grasp domain-containing protein [Actinomadura fibrosa]
MPTLVLSPRYTSDSKVLRSAAGLAGWRTERLSGWRAPERLRGEDVALYGEPTFVEVIAAQLGVALLDVPQGWLPGLPERHRRRSIDMSTLGDVRSSLARPVFVKPADGRKAFEGRVYGAPGELPGPDVLGDDLDVFVCEPVTWDVEFRCHVLDGVVVAMSPYLRDGELALTDEGVWATADGEAEAAREYAETLIAEVEVPPAIVLDVGFVRGRGWAVVEANAAWGAGLYGCDPRAVLDVLARGCVRRISDEDRPWVVEKAEVDRAFG